MNGFQVVMIIAIILFARLGMRLLKRYNKMKTEVEEEKVEKEEKEEREGD